MTGNYEEEDIPNIPTEVLLQELQRRGGHPGALATAALLCIKKGEDYNGSKNSDLHHIDYSDYFPFGLISYAHMIHTKAKRFITLVREDLNGRKANFEGLEDTALDIINYAGFYIASTEEHNE